LVRRIGEESNGSREFETHCASNHRSAGRGDGGRGQAKTIKLLTEATDVHEPSPGNLDGRQLSPSTEPGNRLTRQAQVLGNFIGSCQLWERLRQLWILHVYIRSD
jgi:hypothetical protein